MQRFALVAIALVAMATPAVSSRTPASQLDRAQAHVEALDQEIDMIRNPHLRAQLEDRVDRIERLLNRIERSGALNQDFNPGYGGGFAPDRGPPGYGYGPARPHQGVIQFNDAMRMVRNENFENRKLEVIQSIGGRTRLSSQQARALAAELSFDRNQAAALIALYPSVTDPHRYRLTFDILEFGSNRRHVAQTLGV